MKSFACGVGKRLIAALMVVALGVSGASLSGCNTTEGVGKDIKSAGKGIEEAAQDAKK
jgi:predicted small secreted protein